MYINILVHYPNGKDYTWSVSRDSRLFKLDSEWDDDTGVYCRAQDLGMKISGGYFQVTELSEDKTEAWLEYIQE